MVVSLDEHVPGFVPFLQIRYEIYCNKSTEKRLQYRNKFD